jgi:hypothetical protein
MSGHTIDELGIRITDGLYSQLIGALSHLYQKEEHLVPTIEWVRFKKATGETGYRWNLYLSSASTLKTEDLFKCGRVIVHISAENRERLRGKILDHVVDSELRILEED